MKKFWKDFKAFITKGNIRDMAIGVIIGAAFGKIVTSLVNDIIMPLISVITGGISVVDWKWVIAEAVLDPVTDEILKAESALMYGNFIQTVIDFLIIAICIFIALKIMIMSESGMKDVIKKAKSEFATPDEKKALKERGVDIKNYKQFRRELKAYRIEVYNAEMEEKAAKEAEEKALNAAKPSEIDLLIEIRDELRKKN